MDLIKQLEAMRPATSGSGKKKPSKPEGRKTLLLETGEQYSLVFHDLDDSFGDSWLKVSYEKIKRTTEKAVLFEVTNKGKKFTFWLPKSHCMIDTDSKTVTYRKWITLKVSKARCLK